MLREFLLRRGRDGMSGAEQDRAGGGRALVDGEDIGHGALLRMAFGRKG